MFSIHISEIIEKPVLQTHIIRVVAYMLLGFLREVTVSLVRPAIIISVYIKDEEERVERKLRILYSSADTRVVVVVVYLVMLLINYLVISFSQ